MKTPTLFYTCVTACAMLYAGCAVSSSEFSPGKGTKYGYTYTMSYPKASKDMLFQDDSIIIQFKMEETAIRFQMQNVADCDARINWEKAAISINGQYFAIRHTDNMYADSGKADISITIPSLGYVRDIVVPRRNVYFDGEKWVEKDLLPTMDNNSPTLQKSIRNSTGRSVSLLLPVQFGTEQRNYEFEFQVASVTKIPWKNYVSVRHLPPPPDPPRQNAALDQVTTAVIAVGLLGFSAYVLSMKKNSPTE